MNNVENEKIAKNSDQIMKMVNDEPKSEFVIKPLYQQFTKHLVALFLVAMTGLLFSLFLFYQQTEQTQLLIDKQLTPLKQQYLQQQTLLNAKKLIDQMLIGNDATNLTLQQKKLITFNRTLIRLGSKQDKTYLQWLAINKINREVIKRIQENSARNQQLKQSAVIQLQLMLFTLDSIIVKTTKQKNVRLTKQLLTEILLKFEQLNIHTQLIHFDQLKHQVEQLFVKSKFDNTVTIKHSIKTAKIIKEYQAQLITFEKITLSEQHALAKWQGYLRMTQKFDEDLELQHQQLQQLFDQKSNHSISFETISSRLLPEYITKFLVKYKVDISNELLVLISIGIIIFCIILFSYLLWLIRARIQKFGQMNIELIKQSINVRKTGKNEGSSSKSSIPSCKETKEVIEEIEKINQPKHSESEFLAQQKEGDQSLLLIAEQRDSIENLSNQYSLLNETSEEKLNVQYAIAAQQFKTIQTSANQIKALLMSAQKTEIGTVQLTTDNSYQAHIELAQLNEKTNQYRHHLLLQQQGFALVLSDVSVIDEIHAVLFNVLNKARYQNNHILLNVDPLLLKQAKLDASLFEQLFSVYCDLAFAGQLNAQLTLNLKVTDQNNGQQLIDITGQIKIPTKLKALPELLQNVINSEDGINNAKSDIAGLVSYFHSLLSKQHGENLQAKITEQGYQLSFELPLAVDSNFSKDKELKNDTPLLKAVNILLLTDNVNLSEIITQYVKLSGATIETITKTNYLNQSLNIKQLTRKPIDLVILSAEMAITDYDFILQTISRLPSRSQPKLMVLQTAQLPYDHYGFYSQTQELLCKQKFLQNIYDLLLSDKTNDKLVNENKYDKNQCINCGVNILLGVESPGNHQVLQRFLRWCGLQVTFVTRAIKQNEYWESGNFSLLITEFECSPYIQMLSQSIQPSNIPRGVFSLVKPLVIEVNKVKNDDYKHWGIETITTDIPFEQLMHILEPWLLKPTALKIKTISTKEIVKEEKQIVNVTVKAETALISEMDFTDAILSIDESEKNFPFSFSEYVIHQGTPEIALYMLDDYIQSNYQNFEQLSQAIKEKNILNAQKAVEKIQLNAKILAAKQLKILCQQWLEVLTNKTRNNNFNKVKLLLIDMKKEIIAIDKYAESI